MISIVVPIYNESDVLNELCNRLSTVLDNLQSKYEIILVDDGSFDGSLNKLKQLAQSNSKIVVLELARNYGQTAALAAGIDYASGDTIITMDGDLQHRPEEIPLFLEQLNKGYDIVSGWRKQRLDNPLSRRFPSFCANALMRYLSGMQVNDFGSTFKAYRSELVKKVELFGELHRFIPVLADRIGARIIEIPIAVAPREKGESKYGLSRIFGVFQDLIFLEFYSNYLTKPIRAFGKLFLFFFGSGILISISLLSLWAIGRIDRVLDHGALLLFSVFLMTIGVQFLVAGIFAELLTRIYMQTSNSKIYTVRTVHKTN